MTKYPTQGMVNSDIVKFAWLAGHWYGQYGSNEQEELEMYWSELRDEHSMGMKRWLQKGHMYSYVFYDLSAEDGQIYLRYQNFFPTLAPWGETWVHKYLLVSQTEDEAIFWYENPPEYADPGWLIFRQNRDGTLDLYYDKDDEPLTSEDLFHYHR